MLTKLLEDAVQLAADLPLMQEAINAVQNDLADPANVNIQTLNTDAGVLAAAVATVQTDIAALQSDLDTLPKASGQLAHVREALEEFAENPPANTRLQNLVCFCIPIYNIFAAIKGLPVLPLPAFCTNPTP
jgi:hypothetical protein